MITDDALYSVLNTAITAAAPATPLYQALLYANTRGTIAVDTVTKIVRIDIQSGIFEVANETKFQEKQVDTVIQCFAKLGGETLADIDAALDISSSMARAIFDLL